MSRIVGKCRKTVEVWVDREAMPYWAVVKLGFGVCEKESEL